jgi:nitric oxide dioxygenase
MLTEHQKRLIEDSYRQISLDVDEAGRVFYERLFQQNPNLRPMFKQNLMAQGTKLIQTLGVVVAGLSENARLQSILHDLGQRHQHYGVRPEHYSLVGKALMAMLEQQLHPHFSDDVRTAWEMLYLEVVDLIQPA